MLPKSERIKRGISPPPQRNRIPQLCAVAAACVLPLKEDRSTAEQVYFGEPRTPIKVNGKVPGLKKQGNPDLQIGILL